MSFAFEHHVPIGEDVRRIMSEQLDRATTALDGIAHDPARAIHDCRKRLKKIRAVARLVRPAVRADGYSSINHPARDAGRELARHRDATAIAATYDELHTRWPASDRSGTSSAVADALDVRRRALEDEAATEPRDVERARELLGELRHAVAALELEETGVDAIVPGLAKTYRRGRAALTATTDAPTGERLHELRKRAEYTRCHLDLLRPSAPELIGPLEDAFRRVADGLGDAHDLVVLGARLRGEVSELEPVGDTTTVRMMVDGTRSELEHRAVALGRRLYVESPKRFAQRIGGYWETWDAEDGRAPAGDLGFVLG